MKIARAFLALALLAPVALAAAPIEVHYVVGTGQPNAELFCSNVAFQTPVFAPPSAGGACIVLVPAGAALTVEAIDDARGDVRFYYDLRDDATELGCAHGFAQSPFVLAGALGCDQLTVAPEAGSLAGLVRIAS